MIVFVTRLRSALAALAVASLVACGSATQEVGPQFPTKFSVQFHPGPIVYAVEAEFALLGVDTVRSAQFTVHTKPGNLSRDVHVTYSRSYLERNGAIDVAGGVLRFPVFGLYADHQNLVSVCLDLANGTSLEDVFTIAVGAAPPSEAVTVASVDPSLDTSFLLLQTMHGPAILDIDGELRWAAPASEDPIFSRVVTRDGLFMGSMASNALYHCDWLGRMQTSAMADPSLTRSHHNFSPGKTGVLNTVARHDVGGLPQDLSFLAEIAPSGETLYAWDFDQIFSDTILARGEDPTSFVKSGENWFHMNAAVYDASDDSVIVSSRHNFVVKADHTTGAIKWILGNPEKNWYTRFPESLQPLALRVIGDPPIGQHSVSVSADGQYLMLFNNGAGSFDPEDAQDTRLYSKVSIYRIDAQARTAEEVWSWAHEEGIFSPVCSSAYPTASGNVLAVFSTPDFGPDPRIFIVNEAGVTLFDARMVGPGCSVAYAAEEIALQAMTLE